MRKHVLGTACAVALAAASLAGSTDEAASNDVLKSILGGAIVGVVIGSIVRANQRHCHEGIGCHAHGRAEAYHYHQSYGGPILYQQPVQAAPAGYPQAHYTWCSRYQTYDAGSNTYIRTVGGPRVPCRSPYGG